jgi:group I intron endonuclease
MSDSIPQSETKVFHLYMYRHKINEKAYIGVTSDPKTRYRKHALSKSAAVAFNRAVNKYGIAAFEFYLLAIFDDVEAANYHENAAIKHFRSLSPDGYNLIGGAPKSKYFGPHSDGTKRKIGEANKKTTLSRERIDQMIKAREGQPNHNLGKTFSDEHRAKLSAAHSGVPLSENHRESMVNALRSPDVRAKISKTLTGRKLSPDHRANISAGMKIRKEGEYRP